MSKIYSTRAREKNDVDESFSYSNYQLKELRRCATDPIYFINAYLKLTVPGGVAPFVLRDYQEEQITAMISKENLICVQPRQSGATVIPLAFLLWEAIFYSFKSIGIAIPIGARGDLAINQLHSWHSQLPNWMAPVISRKTRTQLEFDNNSKFMVGQIDDLSWRGKSLSSIFVDSMASADEQKQQDFFFTILAAVSNGRMILTGTPNGNKNAFAKIWNGAVAGQNNFFPMRVSPQSCHSQTMLANVRLTIGSQAYRREFECDFNA